VGKTALAQLLGEQLHSSVVLDVDPNPFADAGNPKRGAFQSRIFQLLTRHQRRDALQQTDLFSQGGVVSDYLFACDRLLAQCTLSRDELLLYDKVGGLLGRELPRPDLVVYLTARPEVLLQRLKRRGTAVPPREHLDRLVTAYAEFFFHYSDSPLLGINTSEIDFVEHRPQLDDLVAVIQKTKAGAQHYSPLGSP